MDDRVMVRCLDAGRRSIVRVCRHQPRSANHERVGFYRIPPFGAYRLDPLSLCYEKPLDCA
jgi:hypothetical protein